VAKKQLKQYNEKETTKNLEEKNNFFRVYNSQRTHSHPYEHMYTNSTSMSIFED
jgi:hypothetical protein